MSWPLGDFTTAAAAVAGRLDGFFAHGPAAERFACRIGIPLGRVRPGRSAVTLAGQARPSLPSPRITFTGRLSEEKGPDLLLAALARMPTPIPTYLVGDGPMRSALQRMVRTLGLAGSVHMPGWCNEPATYISGSSVHVVPSRAEAWSQSAVMALGLGVPVVATAVEGLPLTLADGRGLLVLPENPQALSEEIGAVLNGDRSVDRKGGLRYAAEFDAARIAAYYYASYLDAVSHAERSDEADPDAGENTHGVGGPRACTAETLERSTTQT